MDQAELHNLLGGPPRIGFEDIVAHPRLATARKVYIDRFLELYAGNPFLARLLIQANRFFVFHLVLVLEAAQDPARRETWVTVGLLKEKMALLALASDRQIDHMIARLRSVGFLDLHPSEADRRVRLVASTEQLRAHDRDWLVAHYSGLDLLYPQHDYGPIMRRDPHFQVLLRSVGVALLPVAAKLMMAEPQTITFFENAGTYPVMATLIQAAMAQPDDPHVAVPYAEVGDRFGISRTQVRKLLTAFASQGLLRLHARGGQRVEILPQFWSLHDRGIAVGMFIHDLLHQMAMRASAARARETPVATLAEARETPSVL